jgi:hypothetical protein
MQTKQQEPEKIFGITESELCKIVHEDDALKVHFLLKNIRSRGPIKKSDRTKQCKKCIFVGLRGCMYHGYPDEAIPPYCSFKIGIHAVIPNVEAQLHNQKQHDAARARARAPEGSRDDTLPGRGTSSKMP